MNAPLKIAAFTAALAAAFAVSLGVGTAVGPTGDEPTRGEGAHSAGHDSAPESPESADSDPGVLPAGLMVSENAYSLRLATTNVIPGRGRPIEFTITGPDGKPLTAFDVAHNKRLHLIAVRRDFTRIPTRVHPTMDSAGTWTVPVDVTPGSWRVFADFKPSGAKALTLVADFKPSGAKALTLGADLAVVGTYRPAAMPESRTALVDGYEVTLTGDLTADADADAKLTVTVTKDGQPVTDLQPYLGAYGHLVALREGDLAYLHVHPDSTPGEGETSPSPDVVFYAEVPSDGNYRLYLDFRHQGIVRTAAFVVPASPAPVTSTAAPGSDPPSPDSGQAGH